MGRITTRMQHFDDISTGVLDAKDARELIAKLPNELEADQANELYVALRSWTWKALDQKRRDDELREWIDLFKRAKLRLRGSEQISAQVQVLIELVSESVAVAARLPVSQVMSRKHARELISMLNEAPSNEVAKTAILEKLKLKQANLTRLTNVLSACNLIEIEKSGRQKLYSLSHLGRKEAEKMRASGKSARDHVASALYHVLLTNSEALNLLYIEEPRFPNLKVMGSPSNLFKTTDYALLSPLTEYHNAAASTKQQLKEINLLAGKMVKFVDDLPSNSAQIRSAEVVAG